MNFDPPIPLIVIVALAFAAAATALWREWKGPRRLAPGWFHPLCFMFRLGAIAALTILLLNPSREISQPESAGHSVVLLDASASMNLAAADGKSRWEAAQDFSDKLKKEDADSIRTLTFSNDLDLDHAAETPEGSRTHLAAAVERLLAGNGGALDHITVVSDGCIHDRDQLGLALALANAAKVPISTHVVGIDSPPRNASLTAVQAPQTVRPRSPVAVHVDVETTGFAPDERLLLRVRNDAGDIQAEREFFPSTDNTRPSSQMLVFESGLRSETYRVELTSPNAPPEIDLDDNRFSFPVEIATGKLRVLFCEGTHAKRTIGSSGHCWNDMEMMSRAWEATGEIEHVLLTPWSQYLNEPNLMGVTFYNGEMKLDRSRNFPQTKEEFHQFDVLIVSDVSRGNFSEEQMNWVVDWVEHRGGGFLMGGGNTAFDTGKYDQTPWEKIVPVDMKSYGAGRYHKWFDIEIPESARNHPLWAVSPDPEKNEHILKAHPQFTGMNLVRRAKPGAIVLASVKGGDEPVIVAQTYGRGRSVAFMPDPNGGGGAFYLDWGPADSPVLSAEIRGIELGHGRGLRFNELVATADYGPEPSHPSPWYAQYWVNMVRWLGENSVRWHRDKLAGRVVAAQARPGEKLPVAAEVLSVSEVDDLLALNVGARLDGFDSRRVRLLYDRDRREFTGELNMPSRSGEADKVDVIFDVEVKGETLSQTVSVGVHRGNPEFAQTAPDPLFLADIARATGGSVVDNAQAAFVAINEATERRSRLSQKSWSEPLWSEWWLWIALAVCLCLEWAMRRLGTQRPAIIEDLS